MMYELKKFIFNKRNVGVFGFLVAIDGNFGAPLAVIPVSNDV